MSYLTRALIPTSCIAVTPTMYPRGYLAGRYDAEGLIHDSRWFATLERAESHAASLEAI